MIPEDLKAAHERFLLQAKWTQSIREDLLAKIQLDPSDLILEVGSGTGVICRELWLSTGASTFGVDLSHSHNQAAKGYAAQISYSTADGIALPFPAAAFHLTCCHFLIMWVLSPAAILEEMVRVTQPGGWVCAFAEPDYGGRIDFPDPLEQLGRAQSRSLVAAGADPLIGRKLRALFASQQLGSIKVGVLGGEWELPFDHELISSEQRTLAADLDGLLEHERIEALMQQDRQAWKLGERILYVPTFYAVGRVHSGPAAG